MIQVRARKWLDRRFQRQSDGCGCIAVTDFEIEEIIGPSRTGRRLRSGRDACLNPKLQGAAICNRRPNKTAVTNRRSLRLRAIQRAIQQPREFSRDALTSLEHFVVA